MGRIGEQPGMREGGERERQDEREQIEERKGDIYVSHHTLLLTL